MTQPYFEFPSIVTSSGSDAAWRQRVSRAARAGTLRRLSPGLYTSDLTSPPEDVVRRHVYDIAALLYPGGVIGYRTALEGGIRDHGVLFLTHEGASMQLPGLHFQTVRGHGPLESDTRIGDHLYVAGMPRFLLENLTVSRTGRFVARSTGGRAVEAYLNRRAAIRGDEELNTLRDEARRFAPVLGLEQEQRKLDNLVASLMGTNPAGRPLTPAGRARARGVPVDVDRLRLFEQLVMRLNSMTHAHVMAPVQPTSALSEAYWRNAAFFESYFSNYIEGTEFELDEARAIVFDGQVPAGRPQDAHDILGVFQVVADENKAMVSSEHNNVFTGLLKHRHADIFHGRPDIEPGHFKQVGNRAGNYAFVAPEQVVGTLMEGFKIGQQLHDPVSRAVFMHVLISEVHPFADGNGRLSRLFMNAELSRAGLSRVIVPNVLRDDYLDVVRLLSRGHEVAPLAQLITRAQQFHQAIPFADYNMAAAVFQSANAFAQPGSGQRLRWAAVDESDRTTAADRSNSSSSPMGMG